MGFTPNDVIQESGEAVARSNLTLCLFGKTHSAEWAAAGQAALSMWLAQVPRESLCWASIGPASSKYSAINSQSLAKAGKQMSLSLKQEDNTNSIRVRGHQMHGPDYAFEWTTLDEAYDPEGEYTNLVEMRFPVDHLDVVGVDQFAGWVCKVADGVPFDSGYSAISILPTRESSYLRAGKQIAGLATRHPGLDVSLNHLTKLDLGFRSRGARWITLIGASQISRLGGRDVIISATTGAAGLAEASGGYVVRASASPVVGDVNRGVGVDELKPIARLLEPLTYFGDDALDILFNDNEELRLRWERRFLDS